VGWLKKINDVSFQEVEAQKHTFVSLGVADVS
jgi:hypothetical protein